MRNKISWTQLGIVTVAVASVTAMAACGSSSTTSVSQQAGVADSSKSAAKAFDPATLPDNIPVAFRLDDVQAYWCSSCLTPIFDLFIDEKVPVSFGVIGQEFDGGAPYDQQGWRPAGTQATLDAMAKFKTAKVPYEVASHSYSHPPQGMPSIGGLDAQSADLAKAQQSIQKALGVTPTSFIPPTNRVDRDTYEAMKLNGLVTTSGQCTWPHTNTVTTWTGGDGTPDYCSGTDGSGQPAPIEMDGKIPNNLADGVRTVAAGAVIDSWSDYSLPADPAAAWNWISTQYSNQGFAVIMLHPQELSSNHCNDGSGSLNQDKVAFLKQIMELGKQKNWNFTTFSGLPTT